MINGKDGDGIQFQIPKAVCDEGTRTWRQRQSMNVVLRVTVVVVLVNLVKPSNQNIHFY